MNELDDFDKWYQDQGLSKYNPYYALIIQAYVQGVKHGAKISNESMKRVLNERQVSEKF